jgi:hypothetical protein
VLDKDGEQKPQCVIRSEVLSNEPMKPSKLQRHLQTKHSDCAHKTPEYFRSRLIELNTYKKSVKGYASSSNNKKAVQASYEVVHMIAKKVSHMRQQKS